MIPDEESAELPDLDAAKAEAIGGARDILAEKLRKGEALDGEVIETADETGQVLAVVPLRSAIRLE